MTPDRPLPLLLAVVLALGGCASLPDGPPRAEPPAAATAPPSCAPAAPTAAPPGDDALPEERAAAPVCEADAVQALLQYADRVRGLDAAALSGEITQRGAARDADGDGDIRLALALAQTRQPADTARALGLVQQTLARQDAAPLHPLARLLEARLLQQRRLEEQLDRHNHQLREAQRRNELLGERLEAMRALERSLTTRPARPVPGSPVRGPGATRRSLP